MVAIETESQLEFARRGYSKKDLVNAASPIPLSQVAKDRDVVITRVGGSGAGSLRLREMGLCEGRCIRVLQPADPMICQVDCYRVGLARCLAEHVFVCPLAHQKAM